ncbi:MAG TPA: MarR family transcriptional regulator [Solirubrobacteraceae bacterium]|jgi:DNA-binding MarR family transcriptional regulator
MNLPADGRSSQAEYVSTQLLPRTTLLTRLLAREVGGGLSITDAGLLRSLEQRPLRITALADAIGLAQPTTTLLVKRLESEGLVGRGGHDGDRRVVLVSLTGRGAAAVADFRARASVALRGYLDRLPDDELETLAAATHALQDLIDALQRDVAGP